MTAPDRNLVRVVLDRQYYCPGDVVKGTVHVHLEKSVKIRGLVVKLYGRERVHIDPPYAATYSHKATYTSVNEMLNVGQEYLENQTLNPGDMSIPFQFQLPASALPSYNGRYAEVNWKLSGTLDIPWEKDLSDEVYLVIYNLYREKMFPASSVNVEAKPKVRLDLVSSVFEPGEIIDGKLTLLAGDHLRSVKVQLVQSEHAEAQGVMFGAERNPVMVYARIAPVRVEELVKGPVAFRLMVPKEATTSYKGQYSEVSWSLEVILDIPYAEDYQFYAPITVAIKQSVAMPVPQQTVAPTGTAGPAVVEEVPERIEMPHRTIPQVESGTQSETQLSETIADGVFRVLADGGWKDLITISNELQAKLASYADLTTVKRGCDDLVNQDKLERSGEGEFYAKYRLVKANN